LSGATSAAVNVVLRTIDAHPYASLANLDTAPGISLVDTPELCRITSGSPVPTLRSSAFRVRSMSSVDMPGLWWVGPSTPPAVAATLAAAGLAVVDEMTMTSAPLDAMGVPGPYADVVVGRARPRRHYVARVGGEPVADNLYRRLPGGRRDARLRRLSLVLNLARRDLRPWAPWTGIRSTRGSSGRCS
jgi:hypothetical protein